MKTTRSKALVWIATLFALGGSFTVSCSNEELTVGDDRGGSGGEGGDGTGIVLPGSGGSPIIDSGTCHTAGEQCGTNTDCCSGVCDETSGQCGSAVQACQATAAPCTGSLDCCSLACVDGACAAECISDNEACESGAECCGGSCEGGVCVPLNLACKTGGNACTGSGECCSGLCGDDGKCTLGASYCVQKGDTCREASDCCTGVCNVADGAEIGICGDAPPGPSNCSAGVAGTVCGDCNECCSRLCAPFGPTGVNICQPASGCRLTGEVCRADLDCCGGDEDSGLPGAGNVSCVIEPGQELGVCRNAMSCSPQGNVCHYQDYACSISSAPNKCCDGVGNSGVCQLDTLGVPRCTGLGDMCRNVGETCSSAVDCCDERPCVPDDEGVLRCGGTECNQDGDNCTVNADCCNGSTCVQPVGSTMGVCKTTTDGGGDGTCAEFGQSCDEATPCCGDVPCNGGHCVFVIR